MGGRKGAVVFFVVYAIIESDGCCLVETFVAGEAKNEVRVRSKKRESDTFLFGAAWPWSWGNFSRVTTGTMQRGRNQGSIGFLNHGLHGFHG